MALCITLWSLIPIFAKLGQSNLDHHQYLFFSSLLSFLALLGVGYYRRELGNFWRYSLQTLLFLAFLGFLDFFYYWLLYFGYKEAQGLEVLVFQYSWPIFIVILSPWFLGEKLSMKHALSLLFGFLGVAVVLSQGKMSEIEFSNFKALFGAFRGVFVRALFCAQQESLSQGSPCSDALFFECHALLLSCTLALFKLGDALVGGLAFYSCEWNFFEWNLLSFLGGGAEAWRCLKGCPVSLFYPAPFGVLADFVP